MKDVKDFNEIYFKSKQADMASKDGDKTVITKMVNYEYHKAQLKKAIREAFKMGKASHKQLLSDEELLRIIHKEFNILEQQTDGKED